MVSYDMIKLHIIYTHIHTYILYILYSPSIHLTASNYIHTAGFKAVALNQKIYQCNYIHIIQNKTQTLPHLQN